MRQLYYDEWAANRLNKIVGIFGKRWFHNKKILELGAAHGDIGIQLLKMGAHVCFTDGRQENLNSITDKLNHYNYQPDIKLLDQNTFWTLNETYDLVVHLATLSHLRNWQQDLKCSISHSSMMVLETMVNPQFAQSPRFFCHPHGDYGPLDQTASFFTQEDVESELSKLGCKFIRFDVPELNSSGWAFNSIKFSTVYDWTYDDVRSDHNSSLTRPVQYRRFWLVLK